MSIRNLEKIFNPRAIAVVGASDDTHSVGFTLFRSLCSAGFAGPMFPVNTRRDTVQGVRAFPTVGGLPEAVDLAVVATPAASVPDVIEQCGRAGILGVIVTTAGFGEVGEEGKKLEHEMLRRAKPYSLRIIGPNCLGLIVPSLKLNASFGARMPLDGHVAFLSQSGALCTAVVEWANDNRIGFSHFVSVGSMIDVGLGTDQHRVNELLLVGQRIAMEESDILSEPASKALLEAYGIPVVATFSARKEDAAVRLAKKIGYPVVLKLLSPDITHKSDAGGVVLGIESDRAVREAFRRIMKRASAHDPRARLEGVTVQRMIRHRGHELILGAKKDPIFGTVILFGMGGVAAEVFRDRAVALPPLNERLARRLIESIRGYRLLRGFRDHPPVNLDLLTEILVRFSYLVVHNPLIREMDINPLLAGAGGAWALDACVVLDGEVFARGAKTPCRHPAIHPYPEELVRKTACATARRSRCGPPGPRTCPSGTGCSGRFPRRPSGFAASRPARRSRRRWPSGTASSTTTAS